MDIEKVSVDVNDASVKKLSSACNELQELQERFELKEIELKNLKEKVRNLEENKIPEIMTELGVSMIKLEDGSTVEVKPMISAKIPATRTDEAYQWLREKGHGDMIKNTVTASFNKGQDNLVSRLIQVCEENGFNYDKKQKVEPMTLKAFAREQIEDGKELPMDLFGVYVSNKTKITKK